MHDDNPIPSPTKPPGEDDDIYAVSPLVPDKVDPRSLSPVVPEIVPEDDLLDSDENPPFQFSLADLFLLTTAIASILGVMALISWRWEYAAGLAGVGAFFSVVFLTLCEPEEKAARVACWSILIFYVCACLAALMTRR